MHTQERKKILHKLLAILAVLAVMAAAAAWHYLCDPWGYYWKVSPAEQQIRGRFIRCAEAYLGYNEADGSHAKIIDLYNSHKPLAVDYLVKYSDSWCSTFVSAVSIQTNLTDIIPTECGCQRHIDLFRELDVWEERDDIIPLPGDIIFYDWDQTTSGEATGWADHVGIVVGTKWPFIKVIEGNKDDDVSYRILTIGDTQIRGYAQPDFASRIN